MSEKDKDDVIQFLKENINGWVRINAELETTNRRLRQLLEEQVHITRTLQARLGDDDTEDSSSEPEDH